MWYDSAKVGCPEVFVMPRKGEKMSEEHKAKIAVAHRGAKQPWSSGDANPAKRPEVRKKISENSRGKPKPSMRGDNHPQRRGRVEELNYRATAMRKCICDDPECHVIIHAFQRGAKGKFTSRPAYYAPGHHLRGKKRPPEIGEKISRNRRGKPGPQGEKHWAWKGGVTAEHRKHRQSKEYIEWRDKVYVRDGWVCQDHLKRGIRKKCQAGDIVAHHLMSFWDFPMWRYVVSCGLTLCKSCHSARHDLGNKPTARNTKRKAA